MTNNAQRQKDDLMMILKYNYFVIGCSIKNDEIQNLDTKCGGTIIKFRITLIADMEHFTAES